MRRGEVYRADLQPRSGSEQRGTRPVIVLSHDSFNRVESWRSIIVVPLSTSQKQARRGPTVVPIPQSLAGLTKESIALCHQITTLDRGKLTERLGLLPPDVMDTIEVGLKAAMDLMDLR